MLGLWVFMAGLIGALIRQGYQCGCAVESSPGSRSYFSDALKMGLDWLIPEGLSQPKPFRVFRALRACFDCVFVSLGMLKSILKFFLFFPDDFQGV